MAILADRLATCPDSHLRDAGRASEYAAAALRLGPNEPLVWRACASAAAANGDFEHAKKWQQRVVNSNLLSHQKGDGEERLAAYNSGNPYVPNLPAVDEVLANKKMRRADEAIKNGNFDRAVVLLSEVIAANPKSERAYAIRGLAYYNQQKYEQATADLNLAIELDPKDADSYDTRAHLFQKTSQYRKAVDDYKIVEKLDPNDATGVRNNLAWLLATCPDAPFRDGAKAAESINRSLELHPDNRSAWDTRAAVFAENGQFDHAISWESRYLEGKDLDATQRSAALERLALYKASKPYRQKADKAIVSENVTPSATPARTGK